MLYGREKDIAVVESLLGDVHSGRSAALVVRGEAGIGKTALLDHAAECEPGLRVLRGTGIESEAELPFSALHLLLRHFTGRLGELPAPQAAALRGAFGLAEVRAADPFLVGLATLTLLALLSEERPVLCLVDDAQWLDQASADALLFAARRLRAESVALIFAAREDSQRFPAPGLPELRLSGLDDRDSAALLAERASGLSPVMRDRIIEESCGNPLALIELPAALTPRQRMGEMSPAALPIATQSSGGRVHDSFRKRIAGLPEADRLVLLAAAADGTGDLAAVVEAARALGTQAGDLESLEQADLVHEIEGMVAFRHPLIRTAAYQSAPASWRLAVHGALAEALEGRGDADRAAWHRAAAAAGPDEEAAAQLAGVAERAVKRGAPAAAAAALERAAELTPDRAGRARRFAAAASAAAGAGRLDWAGAIADRAAGLSEEPTVLARIADARAAIEFEQGSFRRSGRILLDGAAHIADDDSAAAGRMLLEAARNSYYGMDMEVVGLAAEMLARIASTDHRHEFAAANARGIAHLARDDRRSAAGVLRTAVRVAQVGPQLAPPLRINAAICALAVGDDAAALDLSASAVDECRRQGLVGLLPHAAQALTQAQLFLGLHDSARVSGEEALRVAEDTGQRNRVRHLSGVLARLAAISGDEETCRALADEAVAGAGVPAEFWADCSLALLDLGLHRLDAASARLADLAAGPALSTCVVAFSLPDFVEAAAGTGRPELGSAALARFEEFAEHTGQPWVKAVALRCRALLAGGGGAEPCFVQAVDLHRQGGRPFERARTEVLYGEWLRRARRRNDAQAQLTSALAGFERLGARPWADRARGELRAAGSPPPAAAAGSGPLDRLTAQERQVVRLAAAGLSNRDIAARLFLSPRTIGYHLYKAFPKLGVASRADLARMGLAGDQ